MCRVEGIRMKTTKSVDILVAGEGITRHGDKRGNHGTIQVALASFGNF